MWEKIILVIISSIFSVGTVTPIVMSIVNKKRDRAEINKINIESESIPFKDLLEVNSRIDQLYNSQLKEYNQQLQENKELRKEIDLLKNENFTLKEKIYKLENKISGLENKS